MKMFFDHIPSEDLKENPKFSELINHLKKKITPSGNYIQHQRDLEKTQSALSAARHAWLLPHILHMEVNELLADLEIKDHDGQLSLQEKQFTEILAQVLGLSELGDHLQYNPDPTSSSSLFGLTQADLSQHSPVHQYIPSVKNTVLSLLEDRLKVKCDRINSFYKIEKEPGNAVTLPSVVEQRQRRLTDARGALAAAQRGAHASSWQLFQELLEGISMMKQMLTQHKMGAQAERDHITAAWLSAKCDAFCLKLKLHKLKIFSETYDTETMKALTKINQHLDSALAQAAQELAATRHSLQGYHAVGPEFAALVAEFTSLQKDVDVRLWGMGRLGAWGKDQIALPEGLESVTEDLAHGHTLVSEETKALYVLFWAYVICKFDFT